MAIDPIVGNVIIKHLDRWRGPMYLREDMIFDSHRENAGRFYMLKTSNTPILNGDRISLHSGNRTVIVDDDGMIECLSREILQIPVGPEFKTIPETTFILTDGTDTVDPVTYNTPIFLILDRIEGSALKYEWIHSETPSPKLVNAAYDLTSSNAAFQLMLEPIEIPPPTVVPTEGPMVAMKTMTKNVFEGYRGAIVIVLLLILLALCVALNK